MSFKTCTRCQQTKELAGFYRKESWCNVCRLEYKKAWALANRETILAKKRAYREANRELVLEGLRKSYQNHKAKHKAYTKAYKKAHPEYAAEGCRRRQLKKKEATPGWADLKAMRQIYKLAREQSLTVDHIIPLNHKLVCGLHVEHNLQLLPASENYRKQNKFDPNTYGQD